MGKKKRTGEGTRGEKKTQFSTQCFSSCDLNSLITFPQRLENIRPLTTYLETVNNLVIFQSETYKIILHL